LRKLVSKNDKRAAVTSLTRRHVVGILNASLKWDKMQKSEKNHTPTLFSDGVFRLVKFHAQQLASTVKLYRLYDSCTMATATNADIVTSLK